MKYTEQAVETLDDAGSVIANKNIEIEQLRQRVQELEAVLRECLEALLHCEGVFDEVRGYPITYDLTIEAIAKIDEVLSK